MAATIALAMSGPMPALQHSDLLGNLLDALIETSPISAEVLDHPDHTGRQYVDALGQNLRELLTPKTQSSAHSNAALQKEATDLVGHSRTCAIGLIQNRVVATHPPVSASHVEKPDLL